MNLLHLTPAHIHPNINIWGNRQTFSFDQHSSSLTLQNTYQPIQSTPALINFEWMNYQNNGFRFQHKTIVGDSFGSLELSTFLNGQVNGIPFLTANNLGFNFHVKTQGIEPVSPSDFSTKNYVDITSVKSVTAGTGLYGGTIDAPFRQYGTIGIADVGITPGLYTWPTALNINAQGQVYGASSGPQPYHQLIPGQGMNIVGNLGTAYLSLQNSGAVPGSYTRMSGYVDIMGRILTVADGEPPDLNTETIGSLSPDRIENYPADNTVFLRGDGNWDVVDFSLLTGMISPEQIEWLSIPPQKIELYPSDNTVFLRGDGLWEAPTFSIMKDVDFLGFSAVNIAMVSSNAVQTNVITVGTQVVLGEGTQVGISAIPGHFVLLQSDPLHSDILIPNRQIHIVFNGQLVAIPCNIL